MKFTHSFDIIKCTVHWVPVCKEFQNTKRKRFAVSECFVVTMILMQGILLVMTRFSLQAVFRVVS